MSDLKYIISPILESFSEYLDWDEETAQSIYGIDQARFPSLVEILANKLKEDHEIAENMRDFWKHQQSGAH